MKRGRSIVQVIMSRTTLWEYLTKELVPTKDVDRAMQFDADDEKGPREFIDKNNLGDAYQIYTYDYDNPPSK